MTNEPNLLAAMSRLASVRKDAHDEVVRAIYAVVGAVYDLLHSGIGFDFFRGMPNLNISSAPYRGLLVRVAPGSRKDDRLPAPDRGEDWGREALVFDDQARLVMARRRRDGEFVSRAAIGDDLRAEDIEPLMRTIDQAITAHLGAVDRGIARYQQLGAIAGKIRAALGGAE